MRVVNSISKLSETCPVYGNGMALGLTNGTNNYGLIPLGVGQDQASRLAAQTGTYGKNIGTGTSGSNTSNAKTLGVTTDPTKSGIVADLSSISGFAPTFVIKF